MKMRAPGARADARGSGFALMALGVAVNMVGTLYGLSMGWWGLGLGAPPAFVGALLPGPPAIRLGTIAAVVLAPMLAMAAAARGWTGMVYLGAMLPGIAWFLLDAWGRREARETT